MWVGNYQADEAHHIGPPPTTESYLVKEKIVEAAVRAGAQALHPGYGFLSENADFAQMCLEAGIEFIGRGCTSERRPIPHQLPLKLTCNGLVFE